MFVDREFQSDTLGRQARDFISWSRDTGKTLSRMYRKSMPKALEIARAWQKDAMFPHGTLSVIHQRDWIHHPAVLIARKRAQTYIQNLPSLNSSTEHRYAHITQVGYGDAAVGLSITRTLPLIPDGITLTFGRHTSYTNYEGIHGMGLIHVSETGKTQCLAQKRTPKYILEEQISALIKKLMNGTNMTNDAYVLLMSRIGMNKFLTYKTF